MHKLILKIALSSYLLFSNIAASYANMNIETTTYSDTTISTQTCMHNGTLVDCESRMPIDSTVNGLTVDMACPERTLEVIYGRLCNYRVENLEFTAVKLQHAYDGLGFSMGQGLSAAYDMNDNNNVVGQAVNSDGELHAVFLNIGANEFSDHYFLDYGQPGLTSAARAISNELTIAGEAQTDSRVDTFIDTIWHSQLGFYRALNALGVTQGVTLDLSRNRYYKEYAAGYGKWTNGSGADGKYHGFIWSFDGNIEKVDVVYGAENFAMAVNDNKIAVGSYYNSSYRSFMPSVWNNGSLSLLPPGYASGNALDINNNASPVIVGYLGKNSYQRAVSWNDNKTSYLPSLNDTAPSAALAISDSRDIVGYSDNKAVIWRNGNVYDLNALVVNGAESTLISAIDINRHGRILVEGEDGYYMLIPTEEEGVDTFPN